MQTAVRILSLVLAILAWCAAGAVTPAAEFMFRARVDGQLLEGRPLAWTSEQMLLLGRDGRLHEFNPKLATDSEKISPHFISYSPAEMRSALQQEFGRRFDVSATRHFLVVHPGGQRDQWADRFEDLYQRFTQYFRVRGFSLSEPAYPLVAIVFRDKAEYFSHAAASGTPMNPGTLGHYDPISNRVFLFDVTADASGANWSMNAATIIHEAVHQTAYNAGIHKRFTVAPRWLVEGLATMFEARGVWEARYDRTVTDRVNATRLHDFRKYAASRRRAGALAELLASDQLFRSDAEGAYAEAWAVTFYLCETQPRLYAAYLEKTADRPLFSDYPPAERMADFQSVFGRDLKLVETQFLRFIEKLK